MAINRGYTPNHKYYDEMGRITPNVEWSESHRPHFEAQVARWMPVARYDNEYKDWFVMSSGKVAAVDRTGAVCLAGYRKKWVQGGSSAITYTADDYAAGTIDITTGVAYAVNGSTTYSVANVTTGLQNQGLIRSTEYAMDFISKPIGFSAYNYYMAAGADALDPSTYRYHNWKPQELVAVNCDYTFIVPVLPTVATDETMANALSNEGTDLTTNGFGTNGWFGSTAIAGNARYSSLVTAGDNVVCYVTSYYPVAHNTTETPISSDATGGLVTEKSAISQVSAAGDWYFDYEVGVLFLYEEDGDAIPSPFTVSSTLTYYHYESAVAAGASSVSSYFCATGDIKMGDFLTYNADSNLIPATLDIGTAEGYDSGGTAYSADPTYDGGDDAAVSLQLEQAVSNYQNGIIGQVLNTITFPRDYLDRVRTAFNGHSDVTYRAPGSATGGRSDQLTYTNSAEKLIIVNLIHR